MGLSQFDLSSTVNAQSNLEIVAVHVFGTSLYSLIVFVFPVLCQSGSWFPDQTWQHINHFYHRLTTDCGYYFSTR